MKDFNELTNEELAALTGKQVGHYKRLNAAEAGVVIPGPEPKPFNEQKPAQDVVIYEIGGCKFTDREMAVNMQSWLMNHQDDLVDVDYNWQVGGSIYYVKGYDGDLAIAERTAYSANLYEQLREQITGYSDRKKAADEARTEWVNETKAFKNQVEYVDEKISHARDRIWREEENQRRFNEYLELAEGNAERAWTFFEKANLELPGFRPVGGPAAVELSSGED